MLLMILLVLTPAHSKTSYRSLFGVWKTMENEMAVKLSLFDQCQKNESTALTPRLQARLCAMVQNDLFLFWWDAKQMMKSYKRVKSSNVNSHSWFG